VVDDALIEQAADALLEAERARVPIPPIRHLIGDGSDVEAGYAVQRRNTDRWVAGGRRVTGRKIGLTSPAVQLQLGVDQPDFGTLFADNEYGDGSELPATRVLQPRAEGEVALVLEHDLDAAPHGFAEIVRAVAFALPAIEIADSRIAGWDIRIADTVADNASAGLYVVGGRPMPLAAVDVRDVPMRMSVNGAEVSTGSGAACLGNPLQAARWLADVSCASGTPLRAGDVLMTGALGPMWAISAGDEVVADFGPLGTVSTRLIDA